VKIRIKEHTGLTALRDVTLGSGLQTPILIVPRPGFWVYINRHCTNRCFMAVTPDGMIHEEVVGSYNDEQLTSPAALWLRFRAFMDHIAKKYSVEIPDIRGVYYRWWSAHASLAQHTYRYDQEQGWCHVNA